MTEKFDGENHRTSEKFSEIASYPIRGRNRARLPYLARDR